MQRELKFRQRNKNNGQFHYWGCSMDPEQFGGWVPPKLQPNYDDPDESEQFTGKYDKTGKEIYDGDIYHQGDPEILYVVVWHDTGLKGKQVGSYASYSGLEYWNDRIVVVGNIHENPELLSGD